ncbi:M20/M25/M40 family metallo-hydrolase [Anaerolineales bacterium]
MKKELHLLQKSYYLWLLWGILVLMACNLGSSPAPPTLAPRPSATPQPTLGYDAPGATPFPAGGDTGSASAASIALYSMQTQVDVDQILLHIQTLQNFFTRHVNSSKDSPTEGIGAAARYIEEQFRIIQQNSEGRLYTFNQNYKMVYGGVNSNQQNIVAILQGYEAGAGTLIVGAHYDSVGGSIENATSYAPGANDNASGVATLIELARILSQKDHKATIIFVAFSAEEVGRRGSIAFTDWILQNRIDVTAMINLDTIGNVHDRFGNVNDYELRVYSEGPNDTSISRQLARNVNFISFNESLQLDLTIEDNIDREGRYGDHFSFSEKGFPAIRFIQANEEKTNADPTDTIDFIEPYYLESSVKTLLGILNTLSNGPRPPTNIALRQGTNGINTLVWEAVPGAASYVVALRWPGSLIYGQQFETSETSVHWDGFGRYVGVAISARDADGQLGPLSYEIKVNNYLTSNN